MLTKTNSVNFNGVTKQRFGLLLCLILSSFEDIESRIQPKNITVHFDPKHIPISPLNNPMHRYEYGERNTSAAYELWNQTGITIIEWPGNITSLEPNFPLLKWERSKAKLVKNQCNMRLGMNFYGYAHQFVYLSWGPYRLTTSYCPPLKIPRRIFKGTSFESSNSTQIPASDFEFVSDAFLIIIGNRYVVRIAYLELSYQDEGHLNPHSRDILSYSVSTGVSLQVDTLVTQSCCVKEKTCQDGNIVAAYNSYSSDFSIFLSTDGGKNFKLLPLSKPAVSPLVVLQTLVLYPLRNEAIIFYGGDEIKSQSTMKRYCLKTGNVKSIKDSLNSNPDPDLHVLENIKGKLQSKRLGEEMSFLLWDRCHVWYSPDAGASITQALFYYHNSIVSGKPRKRHAIIPHNCRLKHSSLAYDADSGKIGLVDSKNHFFYGIDMKLESTEVFPLVAGTLDMTLMKKGTENSIVSNFDINNRAKLMYPPKFLLSNYSDVLSKNFSKRLAVKLLPKTVFPSDFMLPFFEENIPKEFKYLGLQKCLTSGITLNSSLTQKPEMFTNSSTIRIQLEFKSFSSSTKQLHLEPEYYKKFLNIQQELVDYAQLGLREYYYFKYIVTIKPKTNAALNIGDFIRLNFYTVKSLRCTHQAQQTVWIKIVKRADSDDKIDDNKEFIVPPPTADIIKLRQINIKSEGILTKNNNIKSTLNRQCSAGYKK